MLADAIKCEKQARPDHADARRPDGGPSSLPLSRELLFCRIALRISSVTICAPFALVRLAEPEAVWGSHERTA